MNIRTVSTFAFAFVLSIGLSVAPGMVNYSEAAVKKCKSEETKVKTAFRDEKKAESVFNKETRTLESLQRRYDKDVEQKESKAQKCIDKTERLEDNYTRQLNGAEVARQNYISKIAEVTVQQAACQLDLATGGACNVSRLASVLAKLAKDVAKAEQRIATLRKLLNQKLETQRNVCAREDARLATVVTRSLGRVTAQTPKVAAKQAIFVQKTAAREAAEAALLQCQAANP